MSLWDRDGQREITPGATDEEPLSRIGRHFVAGLLTHARGLTGIGSPIVNSYKRLLPGSWAPAHICWGTGNRAALVRIPGLGRRRRVEYRSGDNAANPFLYVCALMAAGLDGIRNELDPPPPADVDVGRLSAAEAQARGLAFLPASLPEALDAFEADPVLTDALGPGDQRGAPQGETRRARRLRSRGASVGACHLPGDILTPAPGTATVRQTRQMDWIDPDEPAACEIVNADGRSRVIFTCDHANARIPRRLGTLGVGRADLERHIAWDIGAAPVARRLSGLLDAPLVLTGYSRLVVDCNRPLSAPDAFVTRSEDVDIPGNAGLDGEERRSRASCFYWPFHDAIDALVTGRTESAAGPVPILVSVHSFTPVYHGRHRPWDAGILHHGDRRLAALAVRWLRADGRLHIGENEPYRMTLEEDFTLPVHAERHPHHDTGPFPLSLYRRRGRACDEQGLQGTA